jgi:hypothetical protein
MSLFVIRKVPYELARVSNIQLFERTGYKPWVLAFDYRSRKGVTHTKMFKYKTRFEAGVIGQMLGIAKWIYLYGISE